MRRCILTVWLVFAVAVTSMAGEEITAGETILLQGQVTDSLGETLPEALVEIWHADANGNYNHPNDSSADELLETFQYFGSAATDEDGYYAFLTIVPAPYHPRPRHIHFKVKRDDEELLTSQLYFSANAEAHETQVLQLEKSSADDIEAEELLVATGNIVLDLNGAEADEFTPTARQQEGPYYPLVTVADYDNNLVSTAADDGLVLPLLLPEFTLINLNTGTSEEFLTIPNVGNRMVREFEEYSPYISIQQFRREIGKYVSEEQESAYEAYVFVPIDVNAADAPTLEQIPGVDETVAAAVMAQRPFESTDGFLVALGEFLSAGQVEYAAHYLERGL